MTENVSNDLTAVYTGSGGTGQNTSTNVKFSFVYSDSEQSYGYLDEQGSFVNFSSGGTDTSDATATAAQILSGYTAYIADGSKAVGTLVVPHGIFKYNDYIEPLSQYRSNMAATSIGNYALFGGGSITGSPYYTNTVDAYNIYLSRSNPAALSQYRGNMAATSIGNYALFGGGDNTVKDTVDAYNTSLSRSTPTALSVARSNLAATFIGDYALFGGGNSYYSPTYRDTVDVYNTSLVRSTATGLSQARYGLAAASNSKYALFAGGYYNDGSNYAQDTVDSYNVSLTRSVPTVLSYKTNRLAATSLFDRALFGGGSNGANSAFYDQMNCYNTLLTRNTMTGLTLGRDDLIATSLLNKYALFGGGRYKNYIGIYYTNIVDVYDQTLSRNIPTGLSVARDPKSTSVGNYAIFAGGYDGTNRRDTVDVYYES